jgi:hypothetical protein
MNPAAGDDGIPHWSFVVKQVILVHYAAKNHASIRNIKNFLR